MSAILKYTGIPKLTFQSLTGKGVKVGIIDSGVAVSRVPVTQGIAIHAPESGGNGRGTDIEDRIGHGTACAGLIRKNAPDCDLYVAKVFHDDLITTPGRIASAIAWMIDREVDIVNLSLGTTVEKDLECIRDACDLAHEKGILLVSAVCNEPGKVAYPAAFETVITVDAGKLSRSSDFYYKPGAEGYVVLGKGDPEWVMWTKPPKIVMGGTSFACARVSGLLAQITEAIPDITFSDVPIILRESSVRHEPAPVIDRAVRPPDTRISVGDFDTARRIGFIKKAVLYPFNKEMHSLVRYRDLLPFEIAGVCDFVGKRSFGKDPAELLGLPPCSISISGNLKEKLKHADTLVLGYLDELERASGKMLFDNCVRMAAEAGKNIYSLVPLNAKLHKHAFKAIHKKGVIFESPIVDKNGFLKLIGAFDPREPSSKPLIAVFGTSPKQGKLTTQLALKRGFTKRGYDVGFLSTEHQGELLGADAVFPGGYSAATNVFIPMESHIPYIRSCIRMIEHKNKDLIICGGQSGIIPFSYADFNPVYSLPSMALLMAAIPDACILVVNSVDSIDFIAQCRNTIEAVGKGKVIALVLGSQKKLIKSVFGKQLVDDKQLSTVELADKCAFLKRAFNLPVVDVVSSSGQSTLIDIVENYLACN